MRKMIGILFFLIFAGGVTVSAEPPYPSFSFTEGREPIFMQTVYQPVGMLGQNLHCSETGERVLGLNNPTGIYIDRENRIFVADRDNHRVVQIDIGGALIQEIGVDDLRLPEGVYVADNGDIWVADTGHNRVVRFSSDGNYLHSITQPDDIRLQHTLFIPIDISMDLRGTLFILLRGSNEGIMMMSQEGEFLGFFGRNRTPLTLVERLLRFIYTEEQIRTNLNRIAPSPTAMAIGHEGFIYTATQATDSGQIKQLNVNSEDLFLDEDFQINSPWFNPIAFTAITVTPSGMIYVTDRANGMVLVHNNRGELLVGFGQSLFGGNFRVGVFGDPVGIAVDSDYQVFVLDRVYNSIHVFSPSYFMLNLLAGVERQLEGRHLDARDNWEEVLQHNAFVRTAHAGMGLIYYREGDFVTAMGYMRNAMDQELYSQARWQQRIVVTRRYFPIVAGVGVGLFVLWLVWAKVLRLKLSFVPKGQNRWLRDFVHAMKIMRHPSDTIYAVTYGRRGSIAKALVWLLLYLLTAIVAMGLTSFSFNAAGLQGFNLIFFLVTNLLPVLVWVLAGYLVGTITKGQGKLSHIFISTVYALMPFILLRIPIAVLSLALTRAELGIYYFFVGIMWAWVFILQLMAIKEAQGYFLGETIKNTVWMLFVSAMVVVFGVAIYGIGMQAWSFMDGFVRELINLV
ncbi:MAG: hypothetical protein FWC73_00425 [Defluviitaleaceae bacterium]|nr:hypothetical protein [Defluviitaleaceae bacterium]